LILLLQDEVRLILDKAEIKGLQFSDSVEEGMRVAFGRHIPGSFCFSQHSVEEGQ